MAKKKATKTKATKTKATKTKATKTKATKKKAAKKASKKQIEQYAHADKRRANNPPVGLVTPATDPTDPPKRTYQYDPHLDPQLVWAGKAERTSFDVPTVSLHVHERIDPKTIIKAVRSNGDGAAHASSGKGPQRQLSLFEEPIESYRGTVSLPFQPAVHGRVAVKIVDDRGIESLKILIVEV
jgi:adenine-specific DNA-methyltransferase